jgi:hypothetical protein
MGQEIRLKSDKKLLKNRQGKPIKKKGSQGEEKTNQTDCQVGRHA